MRYEYRVVPAPERGEKVKGVKGAEGRFAASVERIMNDMAARGWEYQRSDTLPSEERAGLTATQIVWRNLLIFRRPSAQDAQIFQPRMLEPPLILSEPVVAAQSGVPTPPVAPAKIPEPPQADPAFAADQTPPPGPEAETAPGPLAVLQTSAGQDRFPDDMSGDDVTDAAGDSLFDDLDGPLSDTFRSDAPRPEEVDNGVENTGTVIGLPGALKARAERLRSAGG